MDLLLSVYAEKNRMSTAKNLRKFFESFFWKLRTYAAKPPGKPHDDAENAHFKNSSDFFKKSVDKM